MIDSMTGADADALDALAELVESERRGMQRTTTNLTRALATSPWSGRGADRFREDWRALHVVALHRAAGFLEETATTLHRNAAEQRDASAANGGGMIGGGFGPTRPPAGQDLHDQILETRRGMQSQLEDLRRYRAGMDDGPLAWLDDHLPGGGPTRDEIDRRIRRLEALLADPNRQFLKVDVEGEGRIIEVLGDLRDADNIAIHVPGMSTELDHYLDRAPNDPTVLREQMDKETAPGTKNVVIAFLDYDPPDGGDLWNVAQSDSAREGARNLDRLVDSLRADGFSADQITPVAHSYGSTATGWALSHEGLDVSRVAVVGSPGLGSGVDDISDLGRPDVTVYAGRAQGVEVFGAGDAVALAPAHGEDPTDEGFGASRFSTGDAHGHSKYFHDRTSLRNLALIATGQEPR